MKNKKWMFLGLFLAIVSLLLSGSRRHSPQRPVTPRQTAETFLQESAPATDSCRLRTPADCCRLLRFNRL